MKRDEILSMANDIIGGDRQRDYGDVGQNFSRIARLWEQVLDVSVTAEQVALCMLLVKVARLHTTPEHQDSWLDICGYAALGGEIVTDA